MIGEEGIENFLKKRIEELKKCEISGKKISQKNSELVLRFIEECIARGLSKARIVFYAVRLGKILQMVDKDFDKLLFVL